MVMDKVFLNSGAGLLSGSIFQWKENVSISEFTNYMTNQGIHVMWECTWGKDFSSTVVNMTHHVRQTLTCRVEGLGHKIFIWVNFFHYQDLLRDMWSKFMWCNLAHQKRLAPWLWTPKKLKLKGGGIRVKIREGLTALVWKDRWEVDVLTCNSRKCLWPQQLFS